MKKWIELLSVTILLFLSCSKDANSVSSYTENHELDIFAYPDHSLSTRSIIESEMFTEGSSLGVFVTGTGYKRKVARYTYDSSIWKYPESYNDRIYLTDEIATVYGFYPADATLLPLSADAVNEIEINISSVASFDGSDQNDYMYASGGYDSNTKTYPLATASYTQGPRTANLFFHHALTKLAFIVNKRSNYTGIGVISEIALEGKNNKYFPTGSGTMNVANGEMNFTEQTSTLTFTGTANINDASSPTSVTAKALVIPATSTTDVTISLVIDGTKMKATLPFDYPADKWIAGRQYTYSILVSGTELRVGNVEILDWDEIPGGNVDVN